MMYLLLFASGSVLLNLIDGIRLIDSAFETASALGTVGLSIGVTEDLGPLSKCVMMILMFFGRIGGLTVIFAAHARGRQESGRRPEERITIG